MGFLTTIYALYSHAEAFRRLSWGSIHIVTLYTRRTLAADTAPRRGYRASRRRRYALTADTALPATDAAPLRITRLPPRGRRTLAAIPAPAVTAHEKSIRQLPDAFLCLLFLFLCFFFKAKLGVEYLFAQSDGFGSDLYKLVLADKLDRLLKAHDPRRNKSQCLVRTA